MIKQMWGKSSIRAYFWGVWEEWVVLLSSECFTFHSRLIVKPHIQIPYSFILHTYYCQSNMILMVLSNSCNENKTLIS